MKRYWYTIVLWLIRVVANQIRLRSLTQCREVLRECRDYGLGERTEDDKGHLAVRLLGPGAVGVAPG